MFWNLLRMERDKTLKRPLLWIGIAIMSLPIIGYYSALYSFRHSLPSNNVQFIAWPAGLIPALNFATGYMAGTSYGVYLAVIVIGIVTAQEFSWRTLQLWLSHGVPRPLLLGAKLLLSLIIILCIVLACLVVGGALSILFSYLMNGHVDFGRVDTGQLILSYVRVAYAMLPYAALTFMLAVIGRSAILAVGGGLLFATAIEIPLSLVLPSFGKGFALIVQFLPVELSQALNSQNYALARMAVRHSPLQLDPWFAALCILVYTLVFCGIALWAFQRQDLTN